MNVSTAVSDKDTKSTAPSGRASSWVRQARQLHLYLGTLFAPSIVFFALTGALQLFGLHEGHPGEAYQPPAWLAKLGSLHKNQTVAEKRGPAPGVGAGQRPPAFGGEGVQRPQPGADGRRNEGRRRQSPFTFALKWFFLATSLGLVFTTVLGIYMAFKFNRSRAVIWSLLVAGTAIPTVLVLLM